MKHIRFFLSFLLLFFLLSAKCPTVSAMTTGFTTEPLPEKEFHTILSNINISLISSEPRKDTISCFDVNEAGDVAIGYGDGITKTICVYSSNGDFKYGYNFDSYGTFAVEWDGENINIYYVRGGRIVSLAPDGKILDIQNVPNTRENDRYGRDLRDLASRKVGDVTYKIQDGYGIIERLVYSHSQLVAVDANGKETMIYDASSEHLSKNITIFVLAFSFIAVCLLAVFKAKKQS